MPRGDRTGPGGMGPMTGRGAGYCAGYSVPGYANPVGGRGLGRGGGGWGYRNWFRATGMPGWQRWSMGLPSAYGPAWGAPPPVYQTGEPWGAYPVSPYTADQEKDMLKKQVDALEAQIREARQRMEELEEEAEES